MLEVEVRSKKPEVCLIEALHFSNDNVICLFHSIFKRELRYLSDRNHPSRRSLSTLDAIANTLRPRSPFRKHLFPSIEDQARGDTLYYDAPPLEKLKTCQNR